MCSRIGIIQAGEIVALGTKEELRQRCAGGATSRRYFLAAYGRDGYAGDHSVFMHSQIHFVAGIFVLQSPKFDVFSDFLWAQKQSSWLYTIPLQTVHYAH